MVGGVIHIRRQLAHHTETCIFLLFFFNFPFGMMDGVPGENKRLSCARGRRGLEPTIISSICVSHESLVITPSHIFFNMYITV